MTEAHQHMLRDAALHTGAAAGPPAVVLMLWDELTHANMQAWVAFWTIVWLIAQLFVLAYRFWKNDLRKKRRPAGRTEADE